MTEREFATDVVRRLRAHGHEALWAGGCVRDELLGLTPHDYDVAGDARPERVQSLFKRTVAVGASFGVVEVLGPRGPGGDFLKVQVATFRSDGAYSDGRRPDAVTFSSAREDALRRDFTINGMFFDPLRGEVIDYVGGRDDLSARLLRAIGDPAERFREDKLRLLRAARFATRFALRIEPVTADAVRAMADQLNVVSAERIAEEMRKLLTDPRRAEGLGLLRELQLLPGVLPELSGAFDGWQTTPARLAALGAKVSFPLALAATLSDWDRVLAAGPACIRWKLSNSEWQRADWLIHNAAALSDPDGTPPHKLKPLLAHAGADDLLALHRADAVARGEPPAAIDHCEALRFAWSAAGQLDPPPLVTGDDLVAGGMKPGKSFKALLQAARDAQLDGTVVDKAAALELVRRLLQG